LVIIGTYASLHIITGIFIGLKTIKIKEWISFKQQSISVSNLDISINEEYFVRCKNGKKKFWWKRFSGIIVILFLISVLIYSYLFPQTSKIPFYEVLFMLVRSIIVTLVWFFLISPLLLKILKSTFQRKQSKYFKEIDDITILFPLFSITINYCWNNSSQLKGMKRLKKFFSESLLLIIITEFNSKAIMNRENI
jgi:hypothetical protein